MADAAGAPGHARERIFQVTGLALAAREWGPEAGHPVLALHGWMDNAGSFDLLAPLLPGCRLVALDCAGHGYSQPRSPDSGYDIWQDVGDVIAVADALGWSQFHLLGHSRGAAIAALVAGAFPERITRLMMLDGAIPLPGDAANAPATLRAAVLERERLSTRLGRLFPNREQAVLERSRGFTEVTVGAAVVLARRGLREVDGGFRWHVDQRLKATSSLHLTPEQIRAFAAAVTAPTLIILTSVSPYTGRPEFRAFLDHFSQHELVQLEGGHHCHLEGGQAEIAGRIIKFLQTD